jgi:hypothetical protein
MWRAELDMVVLKDGSLLSIVRMDAGDGKDHPYLPYYETRSTDSGATWPKLTPIRGAGSARPRLLVLEDAVLLSGGQSMRMLKHLPFKACTHEFPFV